MIQGMREGIVIKLPRLYWRSFLTFRFLLVGALLFFSSLFAYWYRNVRPFLWIPTAHIETFSARLDSDVDGRIVEMGPQEGDFIKKGQLLFVLDRGLILAKQAQARLRLDFLNTQIEKEKERLGKAMEEYLMATADLEMGIGSSDQVKKPLDLMEEAQGKSEEALSQLETVKAELEILDSQLKKMGFTAPFDGVILKRFKNPGTVVSFGDPIYVLSDTSRFWIEAEVPEDKVGKIAIGTAARIRLPAYPNREWMGKVAYIGSATAAKSAALPFSEQNQTVPIKISIEDREFSPKSGLSARVGLKVR